MFAYIGNYDIISEGKSKTSIKRESVLMENRSYENDDEYRLDRLKEEQSFIFEKMTKILSNEQKYWFYRYDCSITDMINILRNNPKLQI